MITDEVFSQLRTEVSSGEWAVRIPMRQPLPVRNVAMTDDGSAVIVSRESGTAGKTELISASIDCEDTRMNFGEDHNGVKTIVFSITKVRREQKKKIHGGGWREIPYEAVALKLVHLPTYEAERNRARREQERAAEETKRREEEKKSLRAQEAKRAREERQRAVEKFTDEVSAAIVAVGVARLVPNFDGSGFTLELKDGRTVSLSAPEKDDPFDPRELSKVSLGFGTKFASIDSDGGCSFGEHRT